MQLIISAFRRVLISRKYSKSLKALDRLQGLLDVPETLIYAPQQLQIINLLCQEIKEIIKTDSMQAKFPSLSMNICENYMLNPPKSLSPMIVEKDKDFSTVAVSGNSTDDSPMFSEGLDRILAAMDLRAIRTRRAVTEHILLESILGKRASEKNLSKLGVGLHPEKVFEFKFEEETGVGYCDYASFPLYDNIKEYRENELSYGLCFVFMNRFLEEDLVHKRDNLIPFYQFLYEELLPEKSRCLNYIICDGIRFYLSRIGPKTLMYDRTLDLEKNREEIISNWGNAKIPSKNFEKQQLVLQNYRELDITREKGRIIFNILPFWIRGLYPK